MGSLGLDGIRLIYDTGNGLRFVSFSGRSLSLHRNDTAGHGSGYGAFVSEDMSIRMYILSVYGNSFL